MMKIPGFLHRKTMSLHPLVTFCLMCVFVYPAIAISHATENLAAHKNIRNLALSFSGAFFAFFTIILLLQVINELNKIKSAKKTTGAWVGFIIFVCGFCLAVGGVIASLVIIDVLNSKDTSQAKIISKQTAALSYILATGAFIMLVGYVITRHCLKPKLKNKQSSLFSIQSIKKTSNLWFLFIMSLGAAGGFTLKSAPQISHVEIVTYSSMLFVAALALVMPKLIAKHSFSKPSVSALFFSSLGLGFILCGSGVTAAYYQDPISGSMLVVAGMVPLVLAVLLADHAAIDTSKINYLSEPYQHSNQQDNVNVIDDDDDDQDDDEYERNKLLTNQ